MGHCIYKSYKFSLPNKAHTVLSDMRVTLNTSSYVCNRYELGNMALRLTSTQAPIVHLYPPCIGTASESSASLVIDANPSISLVTKYIYMRHAIVYALGDMYNTKFARRVVSKVAYAAVLSLLKNNLKIYKYEDVLFSEVVLGIHIISTDTFSMINNTSFHVAKPTSYVSTTQL